VFFFHCSCKCSLSNYTPISMHMLKCSFTHILLWESSLFYTCFIQYKSI
jgi:hypothetical protein